MEHVYSIFALLLIVSTGSHQQPMFLKNNYKGLKSISSYHNLLVSGETRVVYYHEQTVAVVDLGPNNELHNCDIIEVYEPSEAVEVLRNLSVTIRPQQVSFQEMTKLMQQCELLDKLLADSSPALTASNLNRGNRVGINSLTLLSGILPGTKWCGTGDIAENYHDLGQEAHIDRCCRTHDLCPIKVRAQRTRYNLTNYSLYTKSHCTCDEALYRCLKSAKHPTANIMGQIYFNIIKVPCIEDAGSKRQFIPVKMSY